MISEQIIQQAVQRVVEVAAPSRVIVFGSHARGEATEGSDLDLLVVEPEVANVGEEMIRLHKALWPLNIPVDLLVCSESDFAKKREWRSSAIYWAAREGRVMYAA
ncbi:MAG: nucleotidyltransferase domain-containing protein [Azonexus sp.]